MLKQTAAAIIASPSSVGKSMLARILRWHQTDQDWKIFAVDNLEEAFAVADRRENRLILVDDFLGQLRLSVDHVHEIDGRAGKRRSRGRV
jgi:hypothetical protein